MSARTCPIQKENTTRAARRAPLQSPGGAGFDLRELHADARHFFDEPTFEALGAGLEHRQQRGQAIKRRVDGFDVLPNQRVLLIGAAWVDMVTGLVLRLCLRRH